MKPWPPIFSGRDINSLAHKHAPAGHTSALVALSSARMNEWGSENYSQRLKLRKKQIGIGLQIISLHLLF